MRFSPLPGTQILDWYRENARPLPWRTTDATGWHILLSEVMSQQTPVARVAPVWQQWVERWPTPADLGAERVSEVIRAWGKLGYPRRAMRLHETAIIIAREHHNVVPSDIDTLLSLPGIGDYTARAVAAFAYSASVPVVDTNVRRVIARAIHGVANAGPRGARADLTLMATLLPEDQAATFSMGVMELGATVCTARSPACESCPLPRCEWTEAGQPDNGETIRGQKFTGTDRQVRGLMLDVLRGTNGPVEQSRLDLVWRQDEVQSSRALDSLLADGLIEQTEDGLFCLAGDSN